ncbi:aldo/keto reductase [Dermacoccaceae bacterium W4C1]
MNDRASFAQLDRFVERGGTWLDTADCYSFWTDPSGHGGQSEAVIGRWLAANPGVREQIRISTKVGVEPTDDGPQGLSAPVVSAGIEGSLERLGTDHVDLYWAHGEDRSTPTEEVVAAFDATVSAGQTRRIGLSNHPVWRVEQARSLARGSGRTTFSALQLRDSYLSPRPDVPVEGSDHPFGMVSPETLDYVAEHDDIDLWVYTPLLLGAYDRADRDFTAAYDHPGTTARVAALKQVATELGVPAGQVVIAWLTGGAVPRRPIVGGSQVAHLDSAIDGALLTLTADQRETLDNAG